VYSLLYLLYLHWTRHRSYTTCQGCREVATLDCPATTHTSYASFRGAAQRSIDCSSKCPMGKLVYHTSGRSTRSQHWTQLTEAIPSKWREKICILTPPDQGLLKRCCLLHYRTHLPSPRQLPLNVYHRFSLIWNF